MPAVPAPASNAPTTLAVGTAVGFRALPVPTYLDRALAGLRPDALVGACDVELGRADWAPGRRRVDKMDERSAAWARALVARAAEAWKSGSTVPALWAPILPVEEELQRGYLEVLAEPPPGTWRGVVAYDADGLAAVPAPLRALPRLLLADARGPHQLLDAVAAGADLLVAPFVTAASEAGVALTFRFPPPPAPAEGGSPVRPLGVDLGPAAHATDLGPLEEGCGCYACKNAHRAYVRHLLDAKEMTAWVLLQVHNHAVLDRFFAGVRTSLERGTWEEDVRAFGLAYEPELPVTTAEGPR